MSWIPYKLRGAEAPVLVSVWVQTTKSFSRQSLGTDEPSRVKAGGIKQEKVLGLRGRMLSAGLDHEM